MIATITPSVLYGKVSAPPGKSAMQRACALALLNKGKTVIQNPGNSNDDIVAMKIIEELGANIHFEAGELIVISTGKVSAAAAINCGESGLSLRMFAPIAALCNSTLLLKGTGSLLKRPMNFIDEVFPLLNVRTVSNNGFLPISITGPLHPKNISIDGSSSSQYLTGLLFAFAASVKERVSITVDNLKSKPYIDLSLKLLQHFGYEVSHDQYKIFYVAPARTTEKNITYYTEADWSSASFLLVAAAIGGIVQVKGLDIHSVQADKSILNVLQQCNADINIAADVISVTNKNQLHPFEFDATDCPDLFPPLVALAAYCSGTSVITGISRLAAKESNRAETLVNVFSKMGILIVLKGDAMFITGGKGIFSATVSSHHDHRIAMAAAIAGLNASGNMVIQDAEAVNKSYPDFYKHLVMLGAQVSLSN